MINLEQEQKITNYSLPIEIISNILPDKEAIKDFRILINKVDPKNNFLQDRLKLQEVFLDLNPEIFTDKNFRKIFLNSNYQKDNFKKFIKDIGITDKITTANKEKIIKKASSFSWGDNKETKCFVNRFQLDDSFMPEKPYANSELEELPPAEIPYEEMFGYQLAIFEESFRFLRKQNQNFIIQIPTGGGKTKIAMEIVTEIFNTKTDQKILWVADRKELCQQASSSFEKIWQHKGTKKIMLNRCWDKFNFKQGVNGNNLIIATIDKIINLKKNNKIIDADIIIYDEAHHALAPKYKSAIIFARKDVCNLIGLTATPGRSYDDEEENEELSKMFDDELVRIKDEITNTGKKVSSIKYLQTIGVLSKAIKKPEIKIPELKNIFTKAELKSFESKTDYSKKDLEKIGRNNLRNLKILEELVKIAESGKQILFFATSVTQSKLMFACIKHLGFSAAHIDGSTDTQFRENSIKKFQESKIQILFNFQVLTAGFDAPCIQVVFIARPIKSPVTLLQMIGRGMRGKKVERATEYFDLYYVRDGIFEKFAGIDDIFNMFTSYFKQGK